MTGGASFDKVKDFLEQEYQNLSLWYFVSFLLGCAFYFSREEEIIWQHGAMACAILRGCYLLFKRDLFWRFCILLLLAGVAGVNAGIWQKIRTVNITSVDAIPKRICVMLQGDARQIKKTTRGEQVLLSSIYALITTSQSFRAILESILKTNTLLTLKLAIESSCKPAQCPLQHESSQMDMILIFMRI